MTIEQAKEYLESIDILKYRDDDKNYFFDDVKGALDIAIKSLEMWEKVIKEVEEETKDDNVTIFGRIFINGQKNILKRIKKYKKEIEK